MNLYTPELGKRVTDLQWERVPLATDKTLAFDHGSIISKAVDVLRQEVDSFEIPTAFLSAEFTLTELQQVFEVILGKKLDKSSFRRRLDERGAVELVPGMFREGAYRPAQLYRACLRAT